VPRLTVEEASVAYIRAMRNVLPAGTEGACRICHTFIGPEYDVCFPCRQPNNLDVVVPITYSENLGQMHTALRSYKDGPSEGRRYALIRLTAILWRFLDAHEGCVVRAATAPEFDLVATVPSSTPEADDRRTGLRKMIGWCRPIADRYERVLRATGDAPPGRDYAPNRYVAERRIDGVNVLLIDDTWTAGGHAQSAAHALREAGAASVALVVIGRHLRPEWEVTPGGPTSGDLFDELPTPFDWARCAVH
jgi:predicted amidophosphoribosyltransferase